MASILERALSKLKINRKWKSRQNLFKQPLSNSFREQQQVFRFAIVMRPSLQSTNPLERTESTDTHIFNGNLFRMWIFCFYFSTHDFPPISHLETESYPSRGKFFNPHTYTHEGFLARRPILPAVEAASFFFASLDVCFNVDDLWVWVERSGSLVTNAKIFLKSIAY